TLIIEQTAATPEFTVTAAGDYTIHTLVAEVTDNTDPNYLDLSVIVPGTTTGGDVLNIVTSNGLCAALDVAGAPIMVVENLSIDDNELIDSLKLYPNPVIDNVTLSNSKSINIQSIKLFDISGRVVKSINVNSNSSRINIDISELASGSYFMILDLDITQFKKQLIKR
ncbi:T9SS type A sorting domain-containing protein, partial [Xanthomarina sp. F2636L]|uniref:T9SS type A sorting domain-containing protein n=1 Tax=Xanthomarina sp. F2636L TaxID=2996018 RepID=UPI00225DDEE0